MSLYYSSETTRIQRKIFHKEYVEKVPTSEEIKKNTGVRYTKINLNKIQIVHVYLMCM